MTVLGFLKHLLLFRRNRFVFACNRFFFSSENFLTLATRLQQNKQKKRMLSDKSHRLKILACLSIAATGICALVWLYGFNRFQAFFYREQSQLFRFDSLYFHTYAGQPGGLADYAGSFLTQFFYYPPAGACICLCMLFAAGWLFHKATTGRAGGAEALFFIPVAPAALLLIPVANIRFELSCVPGLLCALAAFCAYIRCAYPLRYAAGIGLLPAVYAVAGGNMLLLAALAVLHELFEKKQPFRRLYTVSLAALAGLIPYAAWKWVYVTAPETAYWAATGMSAFFPSSPVYAALPWWIIPALYGLWRMAGAGAVRMASRRPAVCLAVSALCVAGIMALVFSTRDRVTETVNRMYCHILNERWDKVLRIQARSADNSRHAVYFANIALCETGRMPYDLFRYRQFGPAGLFLDRSVSYFSYMFLGEAYYRLGMMAVAEYCAFESMTVWHRRAGAQTLERMVHTTMMRRDFATCDKYLRPFEHSLFYRKRAKEQRAFMQSCLRDSLFVPPGTPCPAAYAGNFFINCDAPEGMLLRLLEGNPRHRKAFEYLMAYYLLDKNVEGAVALMDQYYAGLGYPATPLCFEEALLVYEDAIRKPFPYPVSASTRERFARYIRARQAGANRAWMEQAFGDTYWFYLQFTRPVPLQSLAESNRY
jgi:hypothetical protein